MQGLWAAWQLLALGVGLAQLVLVRPLVGLQALAAQEVCWGSGRWWGWHWCGVVLAWGRLGELGKAGQGLLRCRLHH